MGIITSCITFSDISLHICLKLSMLSVYSFKNLIAVQILFLEWQGLTHVSQFDEILSFKN